MKTKSKLLIIFGITVFVFTSCTDEFTDIKDKNIIYSNHELTATQYGFQNKYFVNIENPWTIYSNEKFSVGDTIIITTERNIRQLSNANEAIKNLHAAIDDLMVNKAKLHDSINRLITERDAYRKIYFELYSKTKK